MTKSRIDRFPNESALFSAMKGSFYFHPSDDVESHLRTSHVGAWLLIRKTL